MSRTHMIVLAASALSILMLHASAMASEQPMPARTGATANCTCDADDVSSTRCESRITNADGEDGKDNAHPDSGNGGKGGTIKNADKCTGKASANGGKGGSGNRGAKSGNGGKGGSISF